MFYNRKFPVLIWSRKPISSGPSFRGRNRFHLVFICTCLQSLGLRHSSTAVTRQAYTNINYLKLIKSYQHLPQPGFGSSLCYCRYESWLALRQKETRLCFNRWFPPSSFDDASLGCFKVPTPFPTDWFRYLPMPFIWIVTIDVAAQQRTDVWGSITSVIWFH